MFEYLSGVTNVPRLYKFHRILLSPTVICPALTIAMSRPAAMARRAVPRPRHAMDYCDAVWRRWRALSKRRSPVAAPYGFAPDRMDAGPSHPLMPRGGHQDIRKQRASPTV
jgi:hypothetical protein